MVFRSEEWAELPADARAALETANIIMIDDCFISLHQLEHGEDFGNTPMGMSLPQRYPPRYDARFLQGFITCLASVGLKMQLEEEQYLGSVAEELAMYLMIDDAKVTLELWATAPERPPYGRGLIASDPYGDWMEATFEDFDVQLHFDDSQDGLDASPAGLQMGMASLALADWFEPFNPPRVVTPYSSDGIASARDSMTD